MDLRETYLLLSIVASMAVGLCHADRKWPIADDRPEPMDVIQLLEPIEFLEFALPENETAADLKKVNGMYSLDGQLEGNRATVVLVPTGGFWDISQYAYLRIDLTNTSSSLVWIQGRLDNDGALDWEGSTLSMAYLLPGERATLGFPFPRPSKMDDAPSIFDSQYSKPNGYRKHWKPFSPEQVVACRLTIISDSDAFALEDITMGVAHAYGAAANQRFLELPYLDSFGQVRNLNWPGKVTSEIVLQQRAEAENKQMNEKTVSSFNKYGGWGDGPKLEATGFFRVQKYHGRWWFVDPEGRLFFSVGANSIGFSQKTPLSGREALFASLPDPELVPEAFHRGNVHFIMANLYRTYGDDWREIASERLLRRMRHWGLNTIGAWSDPELTGRARIPYTRMLHIGHQFSPLGVQISDPFSMEFRQSLKTRLSKLKQNGRQDSWCLGVFIDNEIYWSQPYVRKAFSLGAGQPARDALLYWLRGRYVDISKLNQAWGTDYQEWDYLGELPVDQTSEFAEDLLSMRTLVAEQYYRVCRDIMREVLPDILYLGSRIHKAPPEVMAAAVRYLDVMSLNAYEPLAGVKIPKGIDKPCLISEFHFGAPDRGVPGPGLWAVGDQIQRARAYAGFLVDGIFDSNVVGAHWFAYSDQSAAGRPGENFQIGFVDVTDTPYPEFSSMCRVLTKSLYSLCHVQKTEPLSALQQIFISHKQASNHYE